MNEVHAENKVVLSNMIESGIVNVNDVSYNKPATELFTHLVQYYYYRDLVDEYPTEKDYIEIESKIYNSFLKKYALYLNLLSRDQRKVIVERFGIANNGVSKTYKEVAELMGTSYNVVKKLYNDAIHTLKGSIRYFRVEDQILDRYEYNKYMLSTLQGNYVKLWNTGLEELMDKYVAERLKEFECIENAYQLHVRLLNFHKNSTKDMEVEFIDFFRESFLIGINTSKKVINRLKKLNLWELMCETNM